MISDSKSAIQALNAYYHPHPILKDIQNLIVDNDRKGKQISFMWVPSHVGIEGNGKVDYLAKEAITTGENLSLSFCSDDKLPLIRNSFNNLIQLDWDLYEECNKLHTIKPKFFENKMP